MQPSKQRTMFHKPKSSEYVPSGTTGSEVKRKAAAAKQAAIDRVHLEPDPNDFGQHEPLIKVHKSRRYREIQNIPKLDLKEDFGDITVDDSEMLIEDNPIEEHNRDVEDDNMDVQVDDLIDIDQGNQHEPMVNATLPVKDHRISKISELADEWLNPRPQDTYKEPDTPESKKQLEPESAGDESSEKGYHRRTLHERLNKKNGVMLVDPRPLMLEDVAPHVVKKYISDLQAKRIQFPNLRREETYSLGMQTVLQHALGKDFESWDDSKFLEGLRRAFVLKKKSLNLTLESKLFGMLPALDPEDNNSALKFILSVGVQRKQNHSNDPLTLEQEYAVVKKWCRYLEGNTTNPTTYQGRVNYDLWQEIQPVVRNNTTIEKFFDAILPVFNTMAMGIVRTDYFREGKRNEANEYKGESKKRLRPSSFNYDSTTDRISKGSVSSIVNTSNRSQTAANPKGEGKKLCNGCGRNHHGKCVFASHCSLTYGSATV
jgi:hypothetical protein